jgi:hypothetical protein
MNKLFSLTVIAAGAIVLQPINVLAWGGCRGGGGSFSHTGSTSRSYSGGGYHYGGYGGGYHYGGYGGAHYGGCYGGGFAAGAVTGAAVGAAATSAAYYNQYPAGAYYRPVF